MGSPPYQASMAPPARKRYVCLGSVGSYQTPPSPGARPGASRSPSTPYRPPPQRPGVSRDTKALPGAGGTRPGVGAVPRTAVADSTWETPGPPNDPPACRRVTSGLEVAETFHTRPDRCSASWITLPPSSELGPAAGPTARRGQVQMFGVVRALTPIRTPGPGSPSLRRRRG